MQVRSSLPSPKKQKGLRLAEELEIKSGSRVQGGSSSGGGGSSSSSGSRAGGGAKVLQEQLQIAGIRYATSDGQQLWRQRWRRWRAREGLPGRALDWGSWYDCATLAADSGEV